MSEGWVMDHKPANRHSGRPKIFILKYLWQLNHEFEIYLNEAVECTYYIVAGSIPPGVSEFFIDIKNFRSHYGAGVDAASNRNEYQEHFLGVKAAGA